MIQGLRNELLNFRTRKLIPGSKTPRKSVDYKAAWEIGILYSVEDLSKHEKVKTFIKVLEKDIKKVEVLTFLGKDKENLEFKFNFYTASDFSFWGELQSETVKKFIDKQFDFLLCLDLETNIYIDNILARCKANCRIGRFENNKKDFFELMIKTDDHIDIQVLIDEMYRYIKVLR